MVPTFFNKKNKNEVVKTSFFQESGTAHGAGERPRTPTIKSPDPKSGASANSATPAY